MINFIKRLLADERIQKFLKFGTTGVLNTAVDFGIFTLLNTFLCVNIYLSQTVSYTLATLNSYIINRRWTFRAEGKFLSMALFKFICVNLTMMLIGMLLIHIGVYWFSLYPLVAKAVSACFVVVLNYLLSNFWVFKKKKES